MMSNSLVVENYRVILEDCSASELSILIIDQNTGETFRAEHFPLEWIKPITVSAAFKHENSTLTCTLPCHSRRVPQELLNSAVGDQSSG